MTSCNNKGETKSKNTSSVDVVLSNLVEDWNKAHTSKDIGKLSNLYDNSIMFYGIPKDKNFCLESKLLTFQKYPDYYQQIYGEIQKEKISETEYKCTFVKRVTFNKKTNDYPSYLIISNKQDNWIITTEGDLVTDKNLAKAKEIKIPKDAIKGDFNGDGTLDYMWLVPPKTEEMGCSGDCISTIKFSDPTIPQIRVENCISGTPHNLGDLNKDGTEEIGLLPGWFTSCWHSYYVWTLKNSQWVYAVDPFSTHCNQWDEGIKPIEIDLNRDGYVLIRYTDFERGDIVVKTESVRIK